MKHITIEEIKEVLGYTDQRPARKWCKENEVLLIKQGKTEFAIESNFREAFERPFITKLKREHGESWKMVYDLYKDGNIPALDTLQKMVSVGQKVYNRKNKNSGLFKEKLETALKGKKAA